jgi:hypothetical protein
MLPSRGEIYIAMYVAVGAGGWDSYIALYVKLPSSGEFNHAFVGTFLLLDK